MRVQSESFRVRKSFKVRKGGLPPLSFGTIPKFQSEEFQSESFRVRKSFKVRKGGLPLPAFEFRNSPVSE